MKLILVAVLLAFSASVLAGGYKPSKPSQYCFYAIYESLESLSFESVSSSTTSSTNSTNSSSSSFNSSKSGSCSEKRETELEKRHGQQSGSWSYKTTPALECTNEIEVESIYASMTLYCSPRTLDSGILFWKALCENGNSELMDLTSIEANMIDAVVAKLPIIDPATYTKTISSPVVVIRSEYRRYHHALVSQILFTLYGYVIFRISQ